MSDEAMSSAGREPESVPGGGGRHLPLESSAEEAFRASELW